MRMWDVDFLVRLLRQLLGLIRADGELCVPIPAHGTLVDVGRPNDDVLHGQDNCMIQLVSQASHRHQMCRHPLLCFGIA